MHCCLSSLHIGPRPNYNLDENRLEIKWTKGSRSTVGLPYYVQGPSPLNLVSLTGASQNWAKLALIIVILIWF